MEDTLFKDGSSTTDINIRITTAIAELARLEKIWRRGLPTNGKK